MEAIILVGGKGTRLQKIVSEVPKPLAPINDRPFLTYLMDNLIKNNVNHFILSTGYKKEMISNYFQNSYNGVKISYAIEDIPLGTGGAILNSLKYCNSNQVYALNGDIYTDYPLSLLNNSHHDCHISLSLIEYEKDDIDRFGRIEINDHHEITKFLEKGKKSTTNYISTGIYLINKKWYLQEFGDLKEFSIELDVFENFKKYNFKGIPSKSQFIDIGLPDSYQEFINLVKNRKL